MAIAHGDIVECRISQVAGETLHVQRRKEFFLNHLSVRLLIKRSDHLAGGNVHNITVSIFTAKATNGRQVAQIMNNLFTRKTAGFRPKHAVTGATAEPRAVGQEIQQGKFSGYPGILHLEFGKYVGNPGFPA